MKLKKMLLLLFVVFICALPSLADGVDKPKKKKKLVKKTSLVKNKVASKKTAKIDRSTPRPVVVDPDAPPMIKPVDKPNLIFLLNLEPQFIRLRFANYSLGWNDQPIVYKKEIVNVNFETEDSINNHVDKKLVQQILQLLPVKSIIVGQGMFNLEMDSKLFNKNILISILQKTFPDYQIKEESANYWH